MTADHPSGSLRDRVGETRDRSLAVFCVLGIAGGVAAHLAGQPAVGDRIWTATVVVVLIPLTWDVLRALRRGDLGVDLIALIAMAGTLAVGEELAGAIIGLMLSGGNALEVAAGRRARRELTSLLERAPRTARRRQGEDWVEVPVDVLVPGDRVIVRAGEVVPVDGTVSGADAVVDNAAMTGESLPVTVPPGGDVRSGVSNAGDAFELIARSTAAESAYASLVKLVQAAETERAPFVRLADRYAVIFLPVTLALAGVAWLASGEAVRAVAVLVVATPCPLILAAPIALISGLSRAARRGIIVKGGTAIETLGSARSVLLDKTGTITLGRPAVRDVVALDGSAPDEVLRLAASVDQLSAHVLATALVADAGRRGLVLSAPDAVIESPGEGIRGLVGDREVAVGSAGWLTASGYDVTGAGALEAPGASSAGLARILVGADGRLIGAIVMADHVREDARDVVGRLRAAGVREVAMVTGDRAEVAAVIARGIGVDRVYADQTPEGKLEVVRAVRSDPELQPVVMVGDGVNDAPALAMADVGVAMGAAGSTVSAQTADVVITVDRIDRIVDAVEIGRRTLGIARESVLWGIGLSMAAMVVAALGHLPPVGGALLQEGIDVAVILNALRALAD